MTSDGQQSELHALCFLYLTFSHSTDNQLTLDELKVVASTVHGWAPGASLEDISGILKQTVASYMAMQSKADRYRRAAEIAEQLKDNMSYDSLQKILSNLVEISRADGELSADEEEFIIATANALGVPAPKFEEPIAGDDYQSKILNALCYLYVTFSHGTDDLLTFDEMKTVAATIQGWAPDSTPEQVGGILRDTVKAYKALSGKAERYRRASKYAVHLRDNLSYDSLHKILSNLIEIAKADGNFSDEEKEFIIATANTLGVPPPDVGLDWEPAT